MHDKPCHKVLDLFVPPGPLLTRVVLGATRLAIGNENETYLIVREWVQPFNFSLDASRHVVCAPTYTCLAHAYAQIINVVHRASVDGKACQQQWVREDISEQCDGPRGTLFVVTQVLN